VITTAEFPGAFQSQQVPGISNHADLAIRSFLIAADLTGGFGTQVKACLALPHLCPCRQQGIGKTADLLFGLAEQMQGQSLCGAGTNPRKSLELVDQPS
tara:strand:+ start:2462 stop:2758 length:297 start_codon:yes stop_codon:yes gene_type:complete